MSWSAPFDELAVGQDFETRGRTVTEADVVAFAALTGDWHPHHADAHWAASSPFGERIAHGMLVISFARVQALWRRDGVPAEPVSPAPACFLLSDLARAMTGEIVHVDGGYHAMGAPIR